jgi:hypothetical protein
MQAIVITLEKKIRRLLKNLNIDLPLQSSNHTPGDIPKGM